MRTYDFNGAPKSFAAASQTLIWSPSDVPGPGVVMYHLGIQATTDFCALVSGGIERIRVKANGATIFDLSFKALDAYLTRFSRANTDPAGSDSVELANGVFGGRVTIPLNYIDAPSADLADLAGFPLNAQPQIEVVLGASLTSGSAVMGWTQNDAPPEDYQLLLDQFLDFAASGRNQRYDLSQDGTLRGICLPSKGIERLKLIQMGRKIIELPGTGYTPRANLIQESQQLDDAPYNDSNGLAGASAAETTDHMFLKLDTKLPLARGTTYIEMDTTSTWALTTPDNTAAVATVVKQGRG